MEIKLPLLQNPVGAIAFFRDELETMTGVKGTHPILAPLLETFLTEMLFAEKVDLFDPRLLSQALGTRCQRIRSRDVCSAYSEANYDRRQTFASTRAHES